MGNTLNTQDAKIKKINKKSEKTLSLDNYDDVESLCTICITNLADTATAPCGHKFFCYKCIENYCQTYPEKGCPICRAEILMIIKIYSN